MLNIRKPFLGSIGFLSLAWNLFSQSIPTTQAPLPSQTLLGTATNSPQVATAGVPSITATPT